MVVSGAVTGKMVAELVGRSRQDLAPSVAEFVKTQGVNDPITAAQVAAAKLLSEYYRVARSKELPISIGRLCELLGIRLRGPIPKTIRPRMFKFVDITRPALRSSVARLLISGDDIVIDINDPNPASARVSIAHEIGHLLIHTRGSKLDQSTLRLPVSAEEEILSEYLGRLLLLPKHLITPCLENSESWALSSLEIASKAGTSLHAAVSRLIDPDQDARILRGAIYWKRNPKVPTEEPLEKQLSPHWHLCPGFFIPVRKCHVLHDSLIARIGSATGNAGDKGEEDVQIGTLKGRFLVDAFAWGSVRAGSRTVLSLFFDT